MSFINTSVDITDLPAAEQLELKPIEPVYLKLLRIQWWITVAVLSIIAAALIFSIPGAKEIKGLFFILIPWFLILSLYRLSIENSFPFIKYAVRENDILFHSGWLIRTLKICPFNRIQNCSVTHGPLERKFGLATLIVYTAGTGGADMRIPGLKGEDAISIKDFILNKIENEPAED